MGAFVVVFAISVLGGSGWVLLRQGKPTGIAIFGVYAAYVMLAPIVSVLNWNSTTGALLIFILVVFRLKVAGDQRFQRGGRAQDAF